MSNEFARLPVDGHQLAAVCLNPGAPAQSDLIAKHILQASLVMLPGAGHLPFLERSGEYHRKVSDWLAQLT